MKTSAIDAKTPLATFPIKNLKKFADLIEFDGPLLSWYVTPEGDNYLYHWFDADHLCNRWLIFNIEITILNAYLNRELTLLTLIKKSKSGFAYMVDIDENLEDVNIWLIVDVLSIPAQFLPNHDSYYEFSPIFEETSIQRNAGSYKLNIQGEWTIQNFTEFPHEFSQVYAFIYSTFSDEPGYMPLERLKKAYAGQDWNGGFSSFHFYDDLEKNISPQHRLRIKSLQYASTGWIELELFTPVVRVIRNMVESMINLSMELKQDFKATSVFLKDKKISIHGVNDSQVSEEILAEVKATCFSFSNKMGFTGIQRIYDLTQSYVITLMMIRSLYKRVIILATYQVEGKVTF
jgi:hypothetical protein